MSTSSDPRVQKPRLPKSYTDEQLTYLRNHLPEFERKSQGAIRGDAKKFALERAGEFIAQFGLPEDFQGVEESESRFKEQIYNWFKNTVGRTRRKLEGRPRSAKKAAEKAAQQNVNWAPNLNTPTIIPYNQATNDPSASSPQNPTPVYSSIPPTPSSIPNPSPNNDIKINLRDAFLEPAIDCNTLSHMIQTYVISNPSPTPLTTIVFSLFEAITISQSQIPLQSSSRAPTNRDAYHTLLSRFRDACSFFPQSIVHAGTPGHLAGPRALQMQVRKFSIWGSNLAPQNNQTPPMPSSMSTSTSIANEMERIATDRQRRKDHIQWARVHAAALEIGMFGFSGDADGRFASALAFSEMMVRDAVWEQDEVEWVAGICVLRAIIRTGMRHRRQRDEYEALLSTYEDRWKEIKDETRQALVTEVLLGAKEDLLLLEESLMA